MVDIYNEGIARLAAGQDLILAEIIEHRGSTPREKGAQMLIWADGGAAGTIGGGRLEAKVMASAVADLTGQAKGCLFPFELSGADAAGMDMICGGSGTVLLTPLNRQDKEVLELAVASMDKRRGAWMVTLLEGNASYTAFVDDEKNLVCGQSLTEGQKKLMLDGTGPAMHTQHLEGVTVYARLLTSGSLLYIFGGGHVGLETAALCHRIGFETAVIDDRPEYANQDRFPHARCIVTAAPAAPTASAAPGSVAEFPDLYFDAEVYVLIMTRGHLMDHQWLRWILSLPVMPKYVGMIGSSRKTAMIRQLLEQEGVPRERIDQVYSPVGLAIGAQTPAEIAVSIAAQLIQIRSKE